MKYCDCDITKPQAIACL